MNELESFFKTILHVNTNFTIRKVYQYDTYPGHYLLAKHNEDMFEEEWMEKFERTFNMFKRSIEFALQNNGLLDNKIGVVIDFQVPGFRNGMCGTILWCHKDFRDGFFLGCNPNIYIKDNLNIQFHL